MKLSDIDDLQTLHEIGAVMTQIATPEMLAAARVMTQIATPEMLAAARARTKAVTPLYEPSVPDAFIFSFESQRTQFDETGTPGISFEQGKLQCCDGCDHTWLALLHRNEQGRCDGIIYYYPKGASMEDAGAVNIFVAPDMRRKGLGTQLLDEAFAHGWPIDLKDQIWSESGSAFIKRYLAKRAER